MEIGTLWPKWPFSAKMATNGAEITRVNFDDFFSLILCWDVIQHMDLVNFGQFSPIMGHYDLFGPTGTILAMFEIKHFLAVFQ